MQEKKKLPINTILILILLGVTFNINQSLGLLILFLALAFNIYVNFYLVYSLKGNKAFSLQDYEGALLNYRKAAKSRFVNASIISGYIILELRCGNIDIAWDYLDNVLDKRKFYGYDFVSLNVSKALILYKKNQISDAIELIKNMSEEYKSTYIYETLSSLLIINNELGEALNLLLEALDYDDSSQILRSNYGEVNFKLENYELAKEYFNPLIDESVIFMEPYYYTGLMEKKNGDLFKCKELLERSLQCNDSILTSISKSIVEKELAKLNTN